MKNPYGGYARLYTHTYTVSVVVLEDDENNNDNGDRTGDAPFKEEKAALEALFLPFVTVVVVHANMAELVEDRHNRRVLPPEHLQVLHIPHRRRHPRRATRRRCCRRGMRGRLR